MAGVPVPGASADSLCRGRKMLKFPDKVKGKYVMKRALLLIIALLFLNGCAPSIYIHSQIDPGYDFSSGGGIFAVLSDYATLTDKNFYTLLVSELRRQGLNVVNDVVNAELILTFFLGEKTSTIDTWLTLPASVRTTGDIGGIRYQETTVGTKTIPYSYDFTVQGIYLSLYDIKSIRKGIFIPVWEGFIGAEKKDYDKYPELCVRKLLEYYGSNFRGHPRIDIYSK